jgi:membrane-associated phospholipid phosphatase
MFQTEPVLFLQSFASNVLTFFMTAVTMTGYTEFYVALLCIILLGFDFRRGFLLLQLLLWVGICTELLKHFLALPRPVDIDSRVRLGAELPNDTPLNAGGAKSFWELPPQENIELFRKHNPDSFGFPSGHVSSSTAFWSGTAILFSPRSLPIAAIVVFLMALSRMYLGRHFLADVIGGLVVGSVLLLSFYSIYRHKSVYELFFNHSRPLPILPMIAILILPALPLFYIPQYIELDTTGRLVGINTALILILRNGYPDDSGTRIQRTGRILLGVALFFSGAFLFEFVKPWIASELLRDFVRGAVPGFLAIWGAVSASYRFGLYRSAIPLKS